MAIISTENPFISYELTLQERAAGSTLSEEQKLMLQNDIAEIAMHKLSLRFDPALPMDFAQKEAELQGQILILQYLIARSNSLAADLTQEVLDRDSKLDFNNL
jgi:hypothetical protein